MTYFSHFILPKDDLIAFLTSAYGNKIVNKSKAHTKLIDDWKCQFELLHTQPLHDMISSDTETWTLVNKEYKISYIGKNKSKRLKIYWYFADKVLVLYYKSLKTN